MKKASRKTSVKPLTKTELRRHQESVAHFLCWRDEARRLSRSLRSSKTKSRFAKQFNKIVEKAEKVKLSDLGI